MSQFGTISPVSSGLPGTAVQIFSASTANTLAQILAVGYMDDQFKIIKANDIWYINYLDASVFPLNTGENSVFGAFRVVYDGTHWSLVPANLFSSSDVLQSLGIYSNTYTNAGGSATTTFVDSRITPSSIVTARWQSSANAVSIQKVTPGVGTLTVTSSGDPGASVLEYISVIPSPYLAANGVDAKRYANAGGSATTVILDSSITASSIIVANWISSANAVSIDKITCTAGTITVVSTGDPGVSVLGYVAINPNAYLTSIGLYSAQYTNAGGSATTTISDANISANSVVIASWATQANASLIEKVTPAAGTLTILSSADPGASILNYIAITPSSNAQFLPLSGGQMTGSILLDRGTATSTAGAATVNHQAGVITTEALTTAAAAAYAFTLTDSRITPNSIVQLQLMGGSNTTRGLELRAIPGNGTAAISIYNNNVAGTALNGTLIFGFVVI